MRRRWSCWCRGQDLYPFNATPQAALAAAVYDVIGAVPHSLYMSSAGARALSGYFLQSSKLRGPKIIKMSLTCAHQARDEKCLTACCTAAQFVANVTGYQGSDLALVRVDIAPGLAGHMPPALLPPGSGSAGNSAPAPAPSSEVRVLVRTPSGVYPERSDSGRLTEVKRGLIPS